MFRKGVLVFILSYAFLGGILTEHFEHDLISFAFGSSSYVTGALVYKGASSEINSTAGDGFDSVHLVLLDNLVAIVTMYRGKC